jgi:hypothetical protein
MRRCAVAALALAALVLAGCGAGTPIDQRRDVAPFSRLEISDGVNVDVARGATPGVVVHAGDEIINNVDTDSEGGVLRVGIHDRGIVIGPDPYDDVSVVVTVPRLTGVLLEGHGDTDLSGLVADQLDLQVRGAGDVTASGRVGKLVTSLHGVGDMDLSHLQARTARVELRGAGDIQLAVSDELSVELHGAGDISYRGDPVVRQDIHGPGDVRRIGR